ncbi:MAG: YncE family protein [Proteobacteria bacterium]|nr:YncE family protein [Pseudomonadota bacterium]
MKQQLLALASILSVSSLSIPSPLMAATSAKAAQYEVAANWPVSGAGHWDLLEVDPVRHHLFVSRGDRVQVVDTTNGKEVGTIAGADGVHGIAIGPDGHGYTTNGKSNSVTEFDLATFKRLRDFPVNGKSPDAVLYDAGSNRLFVFNAHSNNASVLDPANGKEIATIAFDGNPELAVADGRGHIFLNIESNAHLVEIDAANAKIVHDWKMDGCEEPSGIAMDTARRRVFSTCQNKVLAVTNADNGKAVARVAIGEGPDGAAFDPATRSVLVPLGKTGALDVVRVEGGDCFRKVQSLPTQASARTIVLDDSDHRAYTVAAKFGKAAAGEKRPPMIDGSFSVLVLAPKAK